jgi:FHS family L-fucose permease-like MFS transporter
MHQRKTLLYTVYIVYFICGLAQCFEGVFLPEFKIHFSLSYSEEMYTMFAKNMPFVLFSIAIGYYLKKIGYKNCLTISLSLFSLGTWLIVHGLSLGNFNMVLGAFFLIGTGFNFELVAGNPMLAAMGDEKGSSSRLNIGNGLGAIAQIIAPLVIVIILPASVTSIEDKIPYMKGIFIITAIVLALAAFVTFFIKDTTNTLMKRPIAADTVKTSSGIWTEPKVVLGFISIFLVIGVEAGLFGLYRNYVEDIYTGGLSSNQSQKMFTVYFALFALGRFIGSYAQKKIKAATTLAFSLVIALTLIFIMIFSHGWVSVTAITAIGFFVSIFFPTLYSISIEGLKEKSGQASGLLTMGFLGSALLPLIQGKLADKTSLSFSFIIAVIPYLFALYFALKGHRLKKNISKR